MTSRSPWKISGAQHREKKKKQPVAAFSKTEEDEASFSSVILTVWAGAKVSKNVNNIKKKKKIYSTKSIGDFYIKTSQRKEPWPDFLLAWGCVRILIYNLGWRLLIGSYFLDNGVTFKAQ